MGAAIIKTAVIMKGEWLLKVYMISSLYAPAQAIEKIYLFSATQGTFSKTDHIVSQKLSFSRYKKTET